jgi:hypothetical protein
MKTQRTADIWSGIFLATLGLVVIVASFGMQSVFAERLPPRTLPVTLGLTTLLTALLLVIRAYRNREADALIDWPDRAGFTRLLVFFGSLVAFLFLIEPLGLPVASGFFSAFLIWYLDRRLVRSLMIGVVVGLVIQYVFIWLLQLSFPQGFWIDGFRSE